MQARHDHVNAATLCQPAPEPATEEGRRVYVHCWGGLGRTGVVIGCWLVRHGHASGKNVEKVLDGLRVGDRETGGRASPQTPAQFRMMRGWPQR